jgi:MinD-like ATPase involved in chromosome partitioning or flagellar assembly
MTLRFDESLNAFALALSHGLGKAVVEQGRIVRDAFGRLTFVSKVEVDPTLVERVSKEVAAEIGAYVDPERVILLPDYPGMLTILESEGTRVIVFSQDEFFYVHLLDRRVVGSDWLAVPSDQRLNAPTLVFASMKGGVGRSTAICVLATHLSNIGKNVLLVDLDLEAPGLGTMLLDESRRPTYGLLDLLVEESVGGLDEELLANCVGISGLVEGKGLIEVLPATGKRCMLYPENVLAKLSRAMIESPQVDADAKPVRERIRGVLEMVCQRRQYDAILVDSRAGLAEISATALLSLGADVLLFGVDQPQTFEDFGYLLAHFATLPIPSSASDWRMRLKVVHAKAKPSSEAISRFQDRIYEVFADHFYEDDAEEEAFVFSVEDEDAPHFAVPIYLDSNFAEFDPIGDPKFLESSVYRAAFGDFLSYATARLGFEEGAG